MGQRWQFSTTHLLLGVTICGCGLALFRLIRWEAWLALLVIALAVVATFLLFRSALLAWYRVFRRR